MDAHRSDVLKSLSYIQRKENYADWRASPVKADETLFPPHVFIACGDADTLYTPGATLITRLEAAGHPDASFLSVPRCAHAYDKVVGPHKKGWAQRVASYNAVNECIRRGLRE